MTWDEAPGDHLGVEFHDSSVVALEREGSTLIIRLSPAWLHRSAGDLGGDDPGTQWNQDAILRLDEARLVGDVPKLPGWIINGALTTPGLGFDNIIPVPIDLEGDVSLAFDFDEGSSLRITASRFVIELVGEPEFIDLWSPS